MLVVPKVVVNKKLAVEATHQKALRQPLIGCFGPMSELMGYVNREGSARNTQGGYVPEQ
jgi:hypothetical protein